MQKISPPSTAKPTRKALAAHAAKPAQVIEILGSDGNGAVFATLRTGWYALEAADLEVLLTATGANLTALTTGEVHVYWAQSDTTAL